MSKTEADDLKKISTSFLYKHDYFVGFRSGIITWTRNGWGGVEHKESVGIEVSTSEETNYLRIHYTHTDRQTQEKKDFDYKVPLTITNCRFGGKRYWFTCPMYRSGVYCGKRVGVLYKDGDYFACRHCYNLTYSSRNLTGTGKMFGSVCMPDVDKAREAVKRTHYKGKYTRKYRRFLRMEEALDNAFMGMANYSNKRIDKLKTRTIS